MFQALLSRILLGALRHGLTAVGAGLVTDGWLTSGQSNEAVGALLTVLGIAWSAYQSHKDHARDVAHEEYRNATAGGPIPVVTLPPDYGLTGISAEVTPVETTPLPPLGG